MVTQELSWGQGLIGIATITFLVLLFKLDRRRFPAFLGILCAACYGTGVFLTTIPQVSIAGWLIVVGMPSLLAYCYREGLREAQGLPPD